MSTRCGLIGLPNVGKSTIFNALTAGKAEVAGYPFTTINPNAGIVPVPDPRLETLGQLLHPPKLTPTTIEFVDIAGLIQGASQGEGWATSSWPISGTWICWSRWCAALRPRISRISPRRLDPVRDIEIIDTELLLADLEIIRRQLLKTEKAAKSGDKKTLAQFQLLQRLEAFLNQGRWAREFPWQRRRTGPAGRGAPPDPEALPPGGQSQRSGVAPPPFTSRPWKSWPRTGRSPSFPFSAIWSPNCRTCPRRNGRNSWPRPGCPNPA